jgi:putative spermidine/putrescine transport system ATP-binding protein
MRKCEVQQHPSDRAQDGQQSIEVVSEATDRDPRSGTLEDGYVRMQKVWKAYGALRPVVEDLNLSVFKGEFLTLLGPSGSGKTTTLMMLAGFEQVSSGTIVLDGQNIGAVPAYRRGIGVVFQSYALFPNMTVAQNLAYPLAARGMGKDIIRAKVVASLQMIRMGDFADRYPAKLSGGQQQRVALARAMIFEPRLILMDEPLGALDRQLREEMQQEIKDLHRVGGATIVYVTHDQSEALSMSDRIAVFNKGRIEQIDSPHEVYRNPATPFVASFIGETNWLSGTVDGLDGAELRVRLSSGDHILCRAQPGISVGDSVRIAIRPENLHFDPLPEPASRLAVTARDLTYLGLSTRVRLGLDSGDEIVALVSRQVPANFAHDATAVYFRPEFAIPFKAGQP